MSSGRQTAAAVLALLALYFLFARPAALQATRKDPTRLHNGWALTPAGTHESTGDMLLGAALSPDGSTLAMTSCGAEDHTVYLLDASTGKIRQRIPVERAWGGLAWMPNGKQFLVSGGTSARIHRLVRAEDGNYKAGKPLELPELANAPRDLPWVGGLAVSPDGSTVYAAVTASDTVYALDIESGRVKTRRQVNSGARPYSVRLSPEGKRLYVGLWAASSVSVLNAESLAVERTLTTGSHPNDLLVTPERLFVSCGNDDAVVVLDAETGQISEWIVTRLTPRSPAGSTPNALAVSPDGRSLFVANADNNAVAMVDISEPGRSRIKGFIPTAWYPTSVSVSRDGKRLFIGSSKGHGTGANPVRDLPIDPVAPKGYPYIATLLSGLISTIEIPDDRQLAAYSRQVMANSPYSDAVLDRPRRAPSPGENPIPSRPGDASPIKYVLYIIKENRTYDQVLGDLKDHSGRPIGNGDPNLTLFGEDVTPNHHALARDFVLLDNLHCDGEVSVDGHHWSNAAYVPDFMQRTWPQQYSRKGTPPLNEALSATPAGRIWDLCERHGVPFRTYYYHTRERMSAAWAKARAAGRRDYDYVDIFLKEFREFERSGEMPRFMVMALSEDHTRGTTPGAFTPKACVASNDLALGKIVETISHSKYWKEFAIFVIEDDAQNGPDHVDAHRTVAFAISPYTRRRHVDSTFYTTSSMLRTIELILGLPPMSQYDAAATPMYASFTTKPDLTPFRALPPRIDLQAKNPATGARRSRAFDFSEPDRLTEADEDAFNRILWHSVKGAGVPYPGVVRRALPVSK